MVDREQVEPEALRVRVTAYRDRRFFFFSSRRRHTRFDCDWSSDVCSSDLPGPRDQPAHEAWAHDVKRGTDDGAEQPARRTHEPSLRPVRDEVGARGPGYDLDLRASLVQQGRRFERALPGTHHHDPLTGEPTQIGVVEGMRNQGCRQSGKLHWAPGEWADARGHHHAPRGEFLPILQAHTEPLHICGKEGNPASIYIRYRLLLEPLPVTYEVLERCGLGVR